MGNFRQEVVHPKGQRCNAAGATLQGLCTTLPVVQNGNRSPPPGRTMPTNKPRIQVTLEPSTYEAVTALAQASGQSRSSVIAEMIHQSEEPIRRVTAILQAAAVSRRELAAGTRAAVAGAAERLTDLEVQVLQIADQLVGQLGLNLEPPAVHPAGRASGLSDGRKRGSAEDPRPVTRGSGFQKSRPEQKAKRPATPALARVSRKKRGGVES